MLHFILSVLMAGGAQTPATTGAPAQGHGAAQEATTPAPAPGTAGTYKSNAELMDALKKRLAASQGGMTTSAVSNTDQYRVNIVHRDRAAGAIAHPGNTELHYIVEGAGTIVTGGKILQAAGGRGGNATIQDGVTRHVSKGDVIIIPANTPHWYKDVEGQITYLEVRFVAPTK